MSDRRATGVFVNHHLFTQTSVDSGALTMLGTVIHRFREPGEYLGMAERGSEARSFHVRVDAQSPAMQVNVDLASLGPVAPDTPSCGCKHGEAGPHPTFVVNPAGYVVFHVSGGAGGYRVRVGRLEQPKAVLFDSARLDGDDLFAVTLIRPGTYSVRNTITKARGEIVVAYPKAGKRPYQPPAPVEIECTEKTLRPSKIKLEAAQGQVYRFGTPSRIAIELLEPDDGPKGGEPTSPIRRMKAPRRPK
jgi:hypothetical protein